MVSLEVEVTKEFKQRDLELIASENPKLKSLIIFSEDEDICPLDFSLCFFPSLESLNIKGINMPKFNFHQCDYPKLYLLEIESILNDIEKIDFFLPRLLSLSLEHTNFQDGDAFFSCLSKCYSLNEFISYKSYFDLEDNATSISLPRCTTFELMRSDSIQAIRMYAPKAINVSLHGCFDLIEFELLEEPFSGPAKIKQSKKRLDLNLTNTLIEPASEKLGKNFRRVRISKATFDLE